MKKLIVTMVVVLFACVLNVQAEFAGYARVDTDYSVKDLLVE